MRQLIESGFIVSMDSDFGDIHQGQILIEDGVIKAVGKNLNTHGAEVIDAKDMIVCPGFVDTHRHMWETIVRGSIPSCRTMDYMQLVGPMGALMRPEDVYLGNYVGALDALNAGITNILDWSHISNTPEHSDAAIKALQDSGIRAVYAHSCPQNEEHMAWWFNSDRKHPEDIRRIAEQYFSGADSLLTLAMGARAPGFAQDEVVRSDFALARELGIRITIHVIHIGGRDAANIPQVKRLHELGLLGPDVTFVHGNDLSPEELEFVSQSGGTVSISPYVEMLIGHGFPATGRCVEHGMKPSFSVDITPGSPGDMFTQMRTAFAVDRVRAQYETPEGKDPIDLNHRDILEFATIEGARANGLDHKIGSITVGKQADLVFLRSNDINVAPLIEPVGTIVSQADTSNIDSVFVAGKAVKRHGKLLDVDMPELNKQLEQARDRIYEAAGKTPTWK